MTLYAAYGSNMDPARMMERCPHSPLQGTGWITGWRLTFGGEEHGWDGALATLAEDPQGRVFVALYDVTDADAARLDAWWASGRAGPRPPGRLRRLHLPELGPVARALALAPYLVLHDPDGRPRALRHTDQF